ncbi:Zinc-binding dehydrogenase [Pleurostoma richardsiae]|uniref:alcohol dehydrogenase (NADP(+)) n=1 Tax=Pleurostoma richardsiae TaxID=41990 RepID=A0AA38VPQ7_9PEZI|nr:Zinc-binding dehydrogenase [Pleurostoma richardsiae]
MSAKQQNYKFEGWLGRDKSSAEGNMVWSEFEPKPWEETDVDIKITHSGVCGSDIHVLRSGWYPTPYPVCVGHEIVGVAVRVGSEAEGGIKVGDRVGVGAQNDSCQRRTIKGEDCSGCEACASGVENYCPHMVSTYGAFHFNGGKSMGGYATHHRAPSHFVVKIPDAVRSEHAAPMLCGGVTMYSPLVKFGGEGKPSLRGKSVGIVGVGGLGHFGIMFAKALGADRVVGISRRGNKREDALRLGCDEYIATAEDADWAKKNSRSLDLVISTISSVDAPIADYIMLLKQDGRLCQVGLPDDGVLSFAAGQLVLKRVSLVGSCIGSPGELREMLALAAEKNIKPWVETRPMSEANAAIVELEAGKPRYRYVLQN